MIQDCEQLFDVACSFRSVLHISFGKMQECFFKFRDLFSLPSALNPTNAASMVKLLKVTLQNILYD